MNRPATIEALLHAALERRQPILAERHLEAWRVINGAGDGGPSGLTIDRYGDWLVLGARPELSEPTIKGWLDAAEQTLSPRGIVLKRVHKGGTTSNMALGIPPPKALSVAEEDATFLCALDDGAQTGLFLDHRETRLRIRDFARDAEVLNLFAYTCAFSVHAALGGARRVTSVDISKRALRRGRENMEASGLHADAHRWFGDDALAFVLRPASRPYELVIADPPVFGRAKGKTFSLLGKMNELIRGLLAHTAAGGVLVFSTHALELSAERLLERFEVAASRAGRGLALIQTMGLPEWDHPAQKARNDRGSYLKTLVLRVS